MNKFRNLLVGTAAVLSVTAVVTTAEAATVFGPATGAIAFLASPTVTATTATFNSNLLFLYGATGDLSTASGSGHASGTLTFSTVPNTVVPETIANFLTLSDTPTGTFDFDVTSVQTIADSVSPNSTSISLYLLGVVTGGNAGYLPGPTSVTLQINKTGNSAYSASATLASPPSGTPEPMSWAMMLAGFGLSGALLRRARTQVAA